jgi:FkbM family methyltransferase
MSLRSYLHQRSRHAFVEPARVLGWPSALMLWVGHRFNAHIGRRFPRLIFTPVISLRVLGCPTPIYVRLGTSDVRVVEQVFIQKEYGEFQDLFPAPKVMIDCGGNIGCSALYFLNRYPDLQVLLVEPSTENLELCRKNLDHYRDRVRILHAGVWSRPACLVMSGSGWATQVREAVAEEAACVEAIDIPSLLAMIPDGYVDILKIDVESSEIEIFREHSPGWLNQVRHIAIELHDDRCRRVFFDSLDMHAYDLTTFSDLTFCKNIRSASSREKLMPPIN